MSHGIRLTAAERDVCAERRRQQIVEGFSAAHDDKHGGQELAGAAYALAGSSDGRVVGDELEPSITTRIWPWDPKWWKPKSRRRNLVRAAALIIAAIERIDREQARQSKRVAGDFMKGAAR